jgi:molybdate/tungstate transport system substrate-binding protein
MKFVKLLAIAMLFSSAAIALTLNHQKINQDKLVIFHAGSLSIPIAEIGYEFKKIRGVEIQAEASGSVEAIRKVIDLGKKADIIAVADYSLCEKMLMPEFTEFCALFARNEMVLAYSKSSKYREEVNSSNWFEILQRDVKFGFSDPNADPCGYRTLIVLKLADAHYGKRVFQELIESNSNIWSNGSIIIVTERIKTNEKVVIRPKEVDLSAMLQSGALDYIFTYKSVAKQHGLEFVELPAEINLGSYEKLDHYSRVSVVIREQTIRGEPIVYGVTVLKNAPKKGIAFDFLNFMLSERGKEIFERNYHETMSPKILGIIPEELGGVLS